MDPFLATSPMLAWFASAVLSDLMGLVSTDDSVDARDPMAAVVAILGVVVIGLLIDVATELAVMKTDSSLKVGTVEELLFSETRLVVRAVVVAIMFLPTSLLVGTVKSYDE